MKKLLFVLDKVELKYFEFNQLVTSFWLIKESLERNHEVCITTIDRLFLSNNTPNAYVFDTQLINSNYTQDIIYDKQEYSREINTFDLVMFRPDPPVDMNYIFATQVLDFADPFTTLVINSPEGIRNANEKIFINKFPDLIPENITSSSKKVISEFLAEQGNIVLKPLNKCFGKGVFYLNKDDRNANTIIETVTENGITPVMAQRYLDKAVFGDKRVLIIGGTVYPECVKKLPGKGDFKFNTHNDEFIVPTRLSDEEMESYAPLGQTLLEKGIHFAGLDVIDSKIIEINVTSPCFFIKEINQLFNTQLEKRIVDYMDSLNSKAELRQLQRMR